MLNRPADGFEVLERRTLLSSVEFASASQSVYEGGTVDLRVQLSGPGDEDVRVPFSVSGGTATGGGADYRVSGHSVLIPAGQSSGLIRLSLVDDAVAEASETVIVTLGTPTNATLGDAKSHRVTILDNEMPTLSIGDASMAEGRSDDEWVDMVFTVTRRGDLAPEVRARYATSDGTAEAWRDFRPESGTITVPPGATTATIRVPVMGDRVFELTESFHLQLAAIETDYHEFAVNDYSSAVRMGDFNGDGKLDLVLVNQWPDTVSVLLNTTAAGATVPSFAARQNFAAGVRPDHIAMADFNGDGKLDLAIAGGFSNVSVLLNTTVTGSDTVSFAAHTNVATRGLPGMMSVGDINGDGKVDLVVPTMGDNAPVSVLLNTTPTGASTASFAPGQEFVTGGSPMAVAIGDINGDGKADLAVANILSKVSVAVFLNTTATGVATVSFAPRLDLSTGPWSMAVAIEDLNADSRPDLVVMNHGGIMNDGANTVSVLLNTTASGAAAATFADQQDFARGLRSSGLVVGDINGDGKPDLAVSVTEYKTVSVLLNTTIDGATTADFAAAKDFSTGDFTGFGSVAVGDLTGDGLAEVAMPDSLSATVTVFTPSVVVPASFVIADGQGVGAIVNDDPDRQAPLAEIVSTPLIAAGKAAVTRPAKTPVKFTVAYSDLGRLNVKSIDGQDILVTGPKGFSQVATLVSKSATGSARRVVARYQVTPPSGSRGTAVNGTYTIWLKPRQVADVSRNAIKAKAKLGTFAVGPRSIPAVAAAPAVATATAKVPPAALPLFGKKAIATRLADEVLN